MSLEKKIKTQLDNYLEFDSNIIFNICDRSLIFGGAIRDIIADMPINDVDILCESKSAKILGNFLIDNGYEFSEYLTPKDLSKIYSDIKVISEPHTFIKGKKIIQIIRPNIKGKIIENDIFNHLIKNVDISCCGISYDGNKIVEDVPHAIIQCQNKVYEVNKLAKMHHPDRIYHRLDKFEKRGWREINESEKVSFYRDIKIESIISL